MKPEEEEMDRMQAKADADYDQFKDNMAEMEFGRYLT